MVEVYSLRHASLRCEVRRDVLDSMRRRFEGSAHGRTARHVALRQAVKPPPSSSSSRDASNSSEKPRLLGSGQSSAATTADQRIAKKVKKDKAETPLVFATDPLEPLFLARAFSMLLRYKDLGLMKDKGDPGQHGALPLRAFAVLRDWGCQGELFATPFNATLADFCSPFYESDAAFGSFGSFFAFEPTEGNFELNPPFTLSSDVVDAHLRRLLEQAERADRPLAFTMIHASAHAATTTRACKDFVRNEFLLPADRHYYREGRFFEKQIMRAYVPPFATAVIFLMTKSAARKWPLKAKLERDLRDAFAWPPTTKNDQDTTPALKPDHKQRPHHQHQQQHHHQHHHHHRQNLRP